MHIPQQTNVREEWDKPNTFPNKQSLGRFVCFFSIEEKRGKTKETFPKTPPRNILETPEKETKKDREPNINN